MVFIYLASGWVVVSGDASSLEAEPDQLRAYRKPDAEEAPRIYTPSCTARVRGQV